MDLFVYLIFRFFVGLVSILPFRVLYAVSDFFYFMIYRVAGYRKRIVLQNLSHAFPEKDPEELNEISRKFFIHLADIFVESLKAFTMKEEDVVKRFPMKPSEWLEKFFNEGRSVIVVAGHYNNWEWPGIAAGTQMHHKPVGFYKPLNNRYIDDFVKRSRVKGRSALVSITDTAAVFKTDWKEPAAFYMIADQSPASVRLAYWVPFLNQDTATLHGPEKYARIYNMPVILSYSRKIKRGYYEADWILLSEDPSSTKTTELTALYMKTLESVILEQPEHYLWSHRRWKHKRVAK